MPYVKFACNCQRLTQHWHYTHNHYRSYMVGRTPEISISGRLCRLYVPASIERVFSTFGHIHSKLRNKLGVQKAAKLVLCYRMLRGGSEPDYWQSNATDNPKSNWMISDSTFCQFLPYLAAETMFLPAKSTLCQFLPFVRQKQVSAGKKPTLSTAQFNEQYQDCVACITAYFYIEK